MIYTNSGYANLPASKGPQFKLSAKERDWYGGYDYFGHAGRLKMRPLAYGSVYRLTQGIIAAKRRSAYWRMTRR